MVLSKNIQTLAYLLILIIGLGYVLSIGSSLILPFIFAILLSIFILPLQKKLLTIVKSELLSIIISFLAITAPFVIVASIFSYQLYDIVEGLPGIESNLKKSATKSIKFLNESIPFININSSKIIKGEIDSPVSGSMIALRTGIVSTTSMFFSFAMTFIYSFFLLYYRDSFKNFLIVQFANRSKDEMLQVFNKIKKTVQSYVGGMGVVVIILTVLNTVGLYFIGIDYPLFWGALAGVLAIIPFIGTLIGGLLPLLYSISTSDYTWQPIAVATYYFAVQQLEGNFITPKVIGDKVNINPLFAIFALLFFGSFWGIAGVVLALPLISIIRIVFSYVEATKPLAILMSSNISKKSHKFSSFQ